jgi:KDO2-lipid IV(A) lauroyltransferase
MDLGTALRRHLFANGVFRWQYEWRVVAAGLGPWEALREWFTIAGLDKVEQALKSGRGVILANIHFGAARQVVGVLAHLGFAVLSLEADNLHEAWGTKHPRGLSIVPLKNTFHARAVYEAQKVLQQGGLLHLATDGYSGQHGIDLGFLGRKRFVATTFAELALTTGATVLPVVAPIDEEGRARIEFLDPLDCGNESMDRNQRIEQMARNCLALVAARWSTDIGNVMSVSLKKYLNLPVDAAPFASQT